MNTDPFSPLMTFFFLFLLFFNREQPFIVSNQNKRLTFSVTLKNKRESAYNTGLRVDFSENLFFASWSMPVSGAGSTGGSLLSQPPLSPIPEVCAPCCEGNSLTTRGTIGPDCAAPNPLNPPSTLPGSASGPGRPRRRLSFSFALRLAAGPDPWPP